MKRLLTALDYLLILFALAVLCFAIGFGAVTCARLINGADDAPEAWGDGGVH